MNMANDCPEVNRIHSVARKYLMDTEMLDCPERIVDLVCPAVFSNSFIDGCAGSGANVATILVPPHIESTSLPTLIASHTP